MPDKYDPKYYAANRERIRAHGYAYCVANREALRASNLKYRTANTEKERVRTTKYRIANRVTCRASTRAWDVRNPEKRRAYCMYRHAAKLQRTPAWSDLKQIEAVYLEAQEQAHLTGDRYHVDHVIPLQGKLVSGLHVYANLQILHVQANLKKSNRYIP